MRAEWSITESRAGEREGQDSESGVVQLEGKMKIDESTRMGMR